MEPSNRKRIYDKCKKIVKKWENNFMSTFGRPPSKLDIKEADKDVKHAYCMYFKLKTAYLEESLSDVLNDVFNDDNDYSAEINNSDSSQNISTNISYTDSNEESNNCPEFNINVESSVESKEQKKEDKVWGEHLNNYVEIPENTHKKEKKVDLNSTFAKKLFSNAKFSKRNPRKSLNSSRNNSSSDISLSQPATTSSTSEKAKIDNIDDVSMKFNSSLPLKSGNSSFSRSQSVNVISHLLDNNISIRNIDTGWLQRVSSNTGTKLPDFIKKDQIETSTPVSIDKSIENKNYSDDDIISGSDDELSQTFHIQKRIKMSNNSLKPNTSITNIPSYIPSKLPDSPNDKIDSSNKTSPSNDITPQKIEKENIDSEIVNTNFDKLSSSEKSNEKNVYDFVLEEEDSDYEVSVRKRKRNTSKKPAGRTRKDRIEFDDSEDDKQKVPARRKTAKNKPKKAAKPTKKKTQKKSEPETNITEGNNKTEEYEMEYSVKPPPTTVPRFKTLKKINTEPTAIEETDSIILSKNEIAKKKLLKRIQSGSLNDNFVKIDIKKKVFVKGKKHMNFTKYKKQMWKNKKKSLYGPDMDMGGCDGGELTCFKCGKSGHMARSCKENLADALLPLDPSQEDECLLPSLEEATLMAKESVLAVRTPNFSCQKPEEANSEIGENSEAESKVSEFEIQDDEELEQLMLHAEIVEDAHLQSQQEINKKWQQILEEKDVKPLYQLNEDGSLPDTPAEVFEALHLFGHQSFRSGQEQAIMRILCGQSTLVTLSTGSGKSLCYQLPAYLFAKRQNCVSLIISPLVSLMDDQVSGMPMFLKAACLHTNQTPAQKRKVMELIEMGELNVLLVSPEAVTSGEKKSGFGSILRKLPLIAFACIDEAHCVSQWSHNFRPSYLVICRVLKERLGIKTILGLTATSTYATSTSILEHLQVPDGRNGVINDIPLPDNLFLSVSSDMIKDAALKNLLVSDPFDDFDSIIVYCTRREECERIASYLRASLNIKKLDESTKKYKSLSSVAEPYHAGLPASKRRTVQNAFMGGYLRIVVATVAFGMGINKSDIRCVIHYNMPSSFESYVQEVGRAGRDGLPAHCHLFLDSQGNDQNELRRHIYSNSMDRHAIRKLLQKIFVPCECKKICPRHEVAFSIQETVKSLDVPEENISTLLCYLELHERQYLEVLTPVYTMCKVISYGSANNIKKAAKDCPPLAMALALQKKGEDLKENVFEFPVVDVAAAMGWDSGIVKAKLKNLEWETENNAPKRSKITIEYSNLGFHVRAPGNLSSSELDDALDTLSAKKKDQETTALKQLQVVHTTLTKVSEKYTHLCLSEKYHSKSTELKTKIREYFSSESPLRDVEIESKIVSNESQIAADVRNLVAMYRDNNFTGRAVARIFHGIQSPNYPAVIWGRCKFWRVHLNSDFNKVCHIATGEILKMK